VPTEVTEEVGSRPLEVGAGRRATARLATAVPATVEGERNRATPDPLRAQVAEVVAPRGTAVRAVVALRALAARVVGEELEERAAGQVALAEREGRAQVGTEVAQVEPVRPAEQRL
jgi:hypothetical protein